MADKAIRHRCNKCGSVRKESLMHQVRETAKMKFWECLDCDDNRKVNFLPPGWVALSITYTPSKSANDGNKG